ncbi:hypothetical protein [Nocardia otitidiscaviarum]|nr:hypothetical protein [Nocardia otitidiscaviarum]
MPLADSSAQERDLVNLALADVMNAGAMLAAGRDLRCTQTLIAV